MPSQKTVTFPKISVLGTNCDDRLFRLLQTNIAEGKERETIPELIRHLYIAKGSSGELKTQLFIAERVGYIGLDRGKDPRQAAEKISAKLGALIRTLKKK